jgi:hypothetical protein
MKNANMWYNEALDKYATAALTGLVSKSELYNPYDISRKAFEIAKVMIEIKEEYAKKD